jgi:hypothetical protein
VGVITGETLNVAGLIVMSLIEVQRDGSPSRSRDNG